MSNKKILTYTDLLNESCYNARDIDNQQLAELLKQAETIPHYFLPFNGCIVIIDYTQRRHLALSGAAKNLCGYDPRDLIENGLEFIISIFQKDDFTIYNEKIFGQATNFLLQTPQSQHNEYLFTYTYRMRNKDGKWMHLLQQGNYITDSKTRLPLYCIAMVMDIAPFKKDTSMIFAIDKKKNDGGWFNFDNVITNYYYPEPEESKLTKRERELLGRLADGLSSKQIADVLFLSENTVANHRKNILRKTNTKNVADLIRYAFDNGII